MGTVAWARRYNLPILVTLAAAALGLLEAFSSAAIPADFPLAAGERLFVVTQETAIGDDGPVIARALRPNDVDLLVSGLPDGGAAPLRVADGWVEAAQSGPVGTRILNSNSELLRRVGSDASVAAAVAEGCQVPALFLTQALADRLGAQAGGVVDVGGEPVRLAGILDLAPLNSLPGAQGVEAVRCQSRPRDNSDRVLVFSRTLSSAPDLLGRLGAASADVSRNEYQVRWAATDIKTLQGGEHQRRAGWLEGTRLVLLTLAAGAVAILAMLQALLQVGDDHVRRALGETRRHRITRAVSKAGAIGLVSAPIAAGLAGSAILAWTSLDPQTQDLREHVLAAGFHAGIYALLFAGLAGVCLWAARTAQRGGADALRAPNATTRTLPLRAACMAVAALCAAIAVPAAFLSFEFSRLSQSPQGYQVEGLYSAEIRLLGYKDHGTEKQWQSEAWQQLSALLDDLAAVPGVTGIGAVGSAPWSYAGETVVVAGQEHMILAVTATPGALQILRPDRLTGRDLGPTARSGTEVLVHALSEQERTQFVPRSAAVVGELAGIRFSPMADAHRKAIVSPMQGALPPVVSLIFRTRNGHTDAAAVQERLSQYDHRYVVGPVVEVADVIGQRLQPIRLSAVTATIAACFSLALLLLVMVVTLRMYAVSHRKEMAIRLCVGASAGHLVLRITLGMVLVFSIGWIVGSIAGTGIWTYLVEAMRDYRLSQPWSGFWLFPPVLVLVGLFVWVDSSLRTRRLDLREALAA